MPADETVLESAHHTLVANTAYWVAITGKWDRVEIKNRDAAGGDTVWVKVGDALATAPTVAGDNSIAVAPGETVDVILPFPGKTVAGVEQVRAVKLISGGTPDISVTGH